MPFGWADVALTPYHTVVISFVAVVEVVLSCTGEPLAGIPAHLELLVVLFASAEYEASNPPILATAYPHLLVPSADGLAWVPE